MGPTIVSNELNIPENAFQTDFNEGLGAYREGDLKTAQTIFENLAKVSPTASEVFLNLGNVHFQAGNNTEAETNWKKAIDIDPMEVKAYLNLGNLYFKLDRVEEAIANWDIYSRVQKDSANAWLNLGVAYDRLGNLDKAVAAYSVYFGLAPGTAESLRIKNRFDASRKMFENNTKVAETLLAKGKNDEAIEIFRTLLAAYPGTFRIYKTFASMLYQRQEYEEALGYYLRAYDIKQDDVTVLVNLGVIYGKLNRTGDAIWAFHQAMQLPTPDQAKIKAKLETLLANKAALSDYLEEAKNAFRRGKYLQAETMLKRLDSLHLHLGALMSEVTEWLGKTEEALNPPARAAKTYMARATDAQNAGRFDQALHFYEKFLEVKPHGKQADQVHAKIKEIRAMMGAAIKSFLGQGQAAAE